MIKTKQFSNIAEATRFLKRFWNIRKEIEALVLAI